MRRPWLRPPSRAGALAGLTVLAVVLFAAAATGLAVLPGYHIMGRPLAGSRWPWVAASLGGVVVAGGYLNPSREPAVQPAPRESLPGQAAG